MINKEKILLIEYEIEQIINKQLLDEKHITYVTYQKVNNMILKDIENHMRKLDNIKSEFYVSKENSQSNAV